MTSSFADVWLKMGRAKQHVDDLEAEIAAFHRADPYHVIVEDNPQTGKRIAKVGREPAPIPDAMPLVLGDAVHAIRSSLDYFAYAAVSAPPTRQHSPSGASLSSRRPQNCSPL